jgi:hypothetical protein
MKRTIEWCDMLVNDKTKTYYDVIKLCQEETVRETVKECVENAKAKIIREWWGNTGSEHCDDIPVVIKESILSVADKLIKELE